MKQGNKKKTMLFAVMLALFLPMLAVVDEPISVQAAAVKLNATKKTIVIGDTYKLKVKNTSKKVKWTTSNSNVATVSSTGKVTAKRAGTATITAKFGTKKLKCKVIVITQQKSYANQLLKVINKERRRYGYSSFDKDPLLQAAAQKRAKELAKRFSHYRPNGYKWTSAISMDYNFMRASENIGRKYTTPDKVLNAWMKNSSTKSKIISRKYNEIGVGVYVSADGYLYWCAIFAKEK